MASTELNLVQIDRRRNWVKHVLPSGQVVVLPLCCCPMYTFGYDRNYDPRLMSCCDADRLDRDSDAWRRSSFVAAVGDT
jgi:hypothetical protein